MRHRTCLVIFLALCLAGCDRAGKSTPVAAGDVSRGKQLAVQYGCAACHDIPGMPTAGLVGPPLEGIARRVYVAGRLPNTLENMIRWIRFPTQVDPGTLMPDMAVTQNDGRDLAAFLGTLR